MLNLSPSIFRYRNEIIPLHVYELSAIYPRAGMWDKNIICCATRQEMFPGMLRFQSCLWIQCVWEKTGREEDLRFNLRIRWKANTDVRSEKLFQLTTERSLPCWALSVLAAVLQLTCKVPCWWNLTSQHCLLRVFLFFLVLGKPTAQQVGVTRGIIDVDHVHNLCLCHRDQSSCCHAVFHGTHRWRMFHL